MIGLGVVAVIVASALAAALISAYFGGLVLGVGGVVTAWIANGVLRRQRRGRPVQSLGRSRTRDCQQARWAPPSKPTGAPHPPTPAQQRVRPCPGSRRF
jgi:hypothetical protein